MESGTSSFLTHAGSDPGRAIEMEKINLENSVGLNLVGDFYEADSDKCIILCHGFTGDRHEWGRFDKTASELNKEGYNVLTFDFSGCGESEDTPITVEKEVEDLRSAIEFVRSKGLEKIGVVGLSLGGLISARVADEINVLVLWSPVTNKKENYLEALLSRTGFSMDGDVIIKNRREGGVFRKKIVISRQMAEDRKNINQKELLSKIKYPVLVIHGTEDESIPLDDSKKAMQYLQEGSKLEILEGADHVFSEHIDRAIEISLSWFRKRL